MVKRPHSALAFAMTMAMLNLAFEAAGFAFSRDHDSRKGLNPGTSPLGLSLTQYTARLPNIYAVAMSELRELESEPLCHRNAARLLVNNCQLLDGKDEATVLTDSGRKIRDFVDSYAASLAICDLERGGFTIPLGCSKFREPILSTLPALPKPMLHVSSREIDACLSGLAKSDSAWNTWISYRHKALRFCEAARVDNEKAQSIYLYQRLTKVLADLTEGVELELEKRLSTANKKVQEVVDEIDSLVPHVNDIRSDVIGLGKTVSEELLLGIRGSAQYAKDGLQDAKGLQQLIGILIQTVLAHNAEVAASHDAAVQDTARRVGDEMDLVMASLGAVILSSSSLQDQMDSVRQNAVFISQRQEMLEAGVDRLAFMTQELSSRYAHHQGQLDVAEGRTGALLETLEAAQRSAATLSESILARWNAPSRLWPYLVCPVATLVMGSYGLPPSAFRNLGFIAMGEFAAVALSLMNTYAADLWALISHIPHSTQTIHNHTQTNATATFAKTGLYLQHIPILQDLVDNF